MPTPTVHNPQRRRLMQAAGATGIAIAGASAQAADDPWLQAKAITDKLAKVVSFRKADYLITDFGAKPCELVKTETAISHEERGTLAAPAAGAHDCYPAITAAIARCNKEGGGRVVLPKGNWFCAGPVVLLSNVNVHLNAGAQLYFSNEPTDFAKYGDIDCGKAGKLSISRWQSNDCLNFTPLVYAIGQNNIALTGDDWTAILDGQGGKWWDWARRPRTPNGALTQHQENPLNPASIRAVAPTISPELEKLIEGNDANWRADHTYLPALSEAGVPTERRIFGLGHTLRPPMVQFISCNNVLMQGYQVRQTPFWQHHPVNCRNVVIRNVYCNSHGANNDGFDPESCDTVLVEGCTFDTGDDCIAIKSGKNRDIQYGPSQNIVIQKCIMQSGHGAVTLGSEMAGGIQNVYAQDLVFENVHWEDHPLNTAIRLKTNMNRGGYLRNFYVRNIKIPNGVQTKSSYYKPPEGTPIKPNTATTAGAIVVFDCDYAPRADSVRIRPPSVTNVQISNVKVGNVKKDGKQVSCFQAFSILGPVAAQYNGPLPMPQVLPVTNVSISDCDFGTPANIENPYFFYNVRGLTLKNVTIGGVIYNKVIA
ncbi:MAG: glycoside hydrolase family 28 protein [Massilia sp.]